MRNPIEWLFTVCLMLLGCAIALSVAMSLLAEVWPWVVGIGLLVAVVAVVIRASLQQRRRW